MYNQFVLADDTPPKPLQNNNSLTLLEAKVMCNLGTQPFGSPLSTFPFILWAADCWLSQVIQAHADLEYILNKLKVIQNII